ncbi:MAG: oligosaccharide flippase family protein [Candidatus Cyclobacteriaceae bacterium M3_2C_046]
MLKQKLILSYASQIGFQLLQVGASVVVARVAGPTVLGTVAFGTAYVSVLLFISDLGLGTAHMKLVSEGQDEGKCVSTYAALKLVTTLLFTLAVLAMFYIQKYWFDHQFESKAHETVIFILLAGITLNQILYVARSTFMANTEQAKIATVDFSRGLILQPARIIVVVLGFGAIALAWANMASYALMIPVYLYLFRGYSWGKFDWPLARKYLRIAGPVIFIALSTTMINYIDKVLLQFFTNSEQVGFYTAGYKIGGFIILIGKSVKNLFFPLFSQAVARKDHKYIKDKLDKFEKFSFLFIMPVIILVIIFSRVIVLIILGEEYEPSISIMQLVTASMFFMILNMPYSSVISGLGKFKLSAWINMANLGFFILAIFGLGSPLFLGMGADGVALSLLLSNIFIGILYRLYAKKHFPVLRFSSSIGFTLYGLINLGVFFLANQWLPNLIWLDIIFILVYLGLTYLSFYLLGWINQRDFKDLLSLVDFKSMKKYISGEMKKKN